jgi:MoaD family protein
MFMTKHIKILLAATFRETAGQRELVLETGSGKTLRDIMTALAKKYGGAFNKIIDSRTGQIGLETWVMVNGKSIRRTDIALKDKDVVTITVPVGGG